METPELKRDASNKAINPFFAILFIFLISNVIYAQKQVNSLNYPELEDVQKVIQASEKHEGVLFVVYEDEYDALDWVMPRLTYYIELLRKEMGAIPIAIVSHGEEILSLTEEQRRIFPDVHENIEHLTEAYQVPFHVCGAFASLNGLSDEDFPGYIDVVPYGPSQIADYRTVGYEMIDIGLTW